MGIMFQKEVGGREVGWVVGAGNKLELGYTFQ